MLALFLPRDDARRSRLHPGESPPQSLTALALGPHTSSLRNGEK